MKEHRKAETNEANIESNQLPFPFLYTVYGHFEKRFNLNLNSPATSISQNAPGPTVLLATHR